MDVEWKLFWFLFWFGAVVCACGAVVWTRHASRLVVEGILPTALSFALWVPFSYGAAAAVAWLGGWVWVIAADGILLGLFVVLVGSLAGLLR